MKTPKIHWAGGVQTKRARYLRGWPCCCSGDKAEKIASTPHMMTSIPEQVTCAACKRIMNKAVES